MYIEWKYLSCYIPIPIIRRGNKPRPQEAVYWQDQDGNITIVSKSVIDDMMLNNEDEK